MTPNPNPSPELIERLQTRLTAHLSGDRRDDRNWPLVIDAGDLAEIVAALSPQTLPAPGEVPAGMKPWYGGDTVPDDWDGGRVFRRALGLVEQMETDDPGFEWLHHPHGRLHDLDIIAYTPTLATVAAANDEGVARKWFPHLCWAGEPMHEGQFREPWPMDEERTALAKAIFDGWYEGNEDWDSPHNDHLQMRAYFAADAAIRLLSQGGGK